VCLAKENKVRARRLAGSWWLAPLSGLAWLILSGIMLRLTTAQAPIVLMAAVFLLSASGHFLDRARYGFPLDRKLAGHAVAAAVALLLTLVLAGLHDRLSPAADVLAFLLAVIAVALVGGLIPAIIEAVAGTLLLHALLTLQPGKSAIAGVSDAAVLGVLIALAVVVSLLAEEVARRGRQAAFAARAVRLVVEAVPRDEGIARVSGGERQFSADRRAVASLRAEGELAAESLAAALEADQSRVGADLVQLGGQLASAGRHVRPRQRDGARLGDSDDPTMTARMPRTITEVDIDFTALRTRPESRPATRR